LTHAAPSTPWPLIGVFDSGVGGLSVLRAIRQRLPQHPLLYVADSGNAPYGDRSDAFIASRTLAIGRFLMARGATIVVIACNTATTAAVRTLRAHHPDLLIVGVEPGIKPAAALTRNHRVGVMATTGTLRSEKFQMLAQAHAAHLDLVLQPCPGLADAIERGDLHAPDLQALIAQYCEPLKQAHVDTVVLGCTHYPFVAPTIQAALGPHVVLVDTSQAVAKQTAALAAQATGPGRWAPQHPSRDGGIAAAALPLQMWTTGRTADLQHAIHAWMGWDAPVALLPAQAAEPDA
jgi:glutamate racemase